jgi:polyamine oxidase
MHGVGLSAEPPRGYKYVFVQEAKEVFGQDLSDPRLQLGTTVQTIDYTDDTQVRVETDKGEFFASRFVVSTFSVGVLQHQDVHWEPRLPDWKKEAIFSFNMATYQKIFMLFPTQFWGDTEVSLPSVLPSYSNAQFILYGDPEQRGRYAVWQNINAPGYIPQNTSTNVIMVTAVDDMARSNEKRTDAEIQAEAMQVLREMYGDDIPQPDDIIVPRWNSDPLYRGSYSNWPLGVLDQHHENLRQPVGNGRVLFTGEAMSPEAFGYVQGAWLEGQSTGRGIGECIVNGDCPEVEIYEALTTCAQVSSAEAFKRKRSMSRVPRRSHSPGAARRRR